MALNPLTPLVGDGPRQPDARLIDRNVVAVDSRGQPVLDLTREDFQVVEAGKPHTITVSSGTAMRTLLCLAVPLLLHSQTPPARPADPISNDRILGVIPNFQTVSEPGVKYEPLRVRDKWRLFVKESVNPFTFASAAAGAALSQIGNGNPKYGYGATPYLQRFGAAQADMTTQSFFGDAVLASLFREDPRYFRMGKRRSALRRVGYALSRTVITRYDSGRDGFNFAAVTGMGMGIVLSDAYYPRQSVGGGELRSRFITSIAGSALGNLLPEFWPDIREKFHRRQQ